MSENFTNLYMSNLRGRPNNHNGQERLNNRGIRFPLDRTENITRRNEFAEEDSGRNSDERRDNLSFLSQLDRTENKTRRNESAEEGSARNNERRRDNFRFRSRPDRRENRTRRNESAQEGSARDNEERRDNCRLRSRPERRENKTERNKSAEEDYGRNNEGRRDKLRFRSQSDRSENKTRRNESAEEGSGRNNERRLNRGRLNELRALRFKRLEEMSKMEAQEIILELVSKKAGFRELLDSRMSPDALVLIFKILAKACSAPLKANKMAIINVTNNENFHKNYCEFILVSMFANPGDKRRSSYFWNDVSNFFSNAYVVFQSVFETTPTYSSQVLNKTLEVSIHTLSKFVTDGLVSFETKVLFEKLNEKIKTYKAEIEIKKTMTFSYEEEPPPPDDFRQLTVYPTYEELRSDAFLRKNIIDRAYDSVNHYLDVQFRLLKEDFVAPLRDGVSEYMRQNTTKPCSKFSGIRVYRDVKFLSPNYSRDKMGVLLQFEIIKSSKRKRQGKYAYNKRFMYGSLVCFSKDQFKTILFGKIIERDLELLEEGMVVVGFEVGNDNYVLNESYVMIECSVYFEPYYHVLKALQNIQKDDFPMEKYIINVDRNMQKPSYLTNLSIYKFDRFQIPLFMKGWPTATELQLNDSQYCAFKAGLTEEYVIIQGPPGTGKTYIGFKIAKALIQNKQYWHQGSPILTICYTNHALDQFLEGIVTSTDKIVRVGGQSKNKDLEKFSLREARRTFSRRCSISSSYNGAVYVAQNELRENLEKMKSLSEELEEIRKCRIIVQFRNFDVIEPELSTSWFGNAKNKQIIDWLMETKTSIPRGLHRRNLPSKTLEENNTDDLQCEGNAEAELIQIYFEQMLEEDGTDFDFKELLVSRKSFLISLKDMEDSVQNLRKQMDILTATENDDDIVFSQEIALREEIEKLEDDIEFIQSRFEKFKNITELRKPENCDLKNPSTMSADDRWMLYFYWLRLYQEFIIKQLLELQVTQSNLDKEYMELRDVQDIEIMKEMLVVGMTTTSAARMQSVLQGLRSPIVIVEEAAEVLESHIVVSLTKHCKHVILIGDHQQLRPSTANYRMEKKFNLGVSLFERMVLNNVQCYTLNVQHRMRPEIAKLIVPSIYSKLDNHPSVENFPSVIGVINNLYFIDHNFPENEIADSKENIYEAKYLIALATYLIQNGYQPEDVTILAAYSAQMFALWKERKNCEHLLGNVRITVLDNYQGEESKIILLSLVRNNSEGKIGFLKIENRVCVALSRAKEGFYIMGNMKMLCEGSQVWPKIKEALIEQNCFGTSLTLRCQIHPTQFTKITTVEDFINVSEGGCSQLCDTLMNCGHVCPKICHTIDRKHENITCKEPCIKILCENEHLCPKLCSEKCGKCMVMIRKRLKCLHEARFPCSVDQKQVRCTKLVSTVLPCGHEDANKMCHVPIDFHICPFPCQTRVEPCGHACSLTCHIKNDPDHLKYKCRKPCARPSKECSTGSHMCQRECYEECSPCEIIVEKRRSTCTHRIQICCNENPDKLVCLMSCRRLLPCGHACKKKCSEPCGDCKVKVKKQLVDCGHTVVVKCSETPRKGQCNEPCLKILECGHICQEKCNERCTTQCRELVNHVKETDCGHKFKIECCMLNQVIPSNSYELLRFCDVPCGATLECNHVCSGTCGSCAQGRIHETCKQKCGIILICGHECPFPCREACQPCNRQCSYKCFHSSCGKKCGEPCTKCAEKCLKNCVHVKCLEKCGDVCTQPPCTEPCKRKLKCGHSCVGYCGDPCPALCRICDYDNLTETFFGTEDEEDARFVLLNDCKHVVESSGMEQWITVNAGDEINYKSCPKCKTPLTSTQRYSNYIKQNLRDIIEVKLKYFGTSQENEIKQKELMEKIPILMQHASELSGSKYFSKIVNDLQQRILPVNQDRKQTLNIILARTYLSKIQILENIIKAVGTATLQSPHIIKLAMDHMDFLLSFLVQDDRGITNQVISDYEKETKRFSRIVQILKISENDLFPHQIYKQANYKNLYEIAYKNIFSIQLYTDSLDVGIKENITILAKQLGTGITDYERQQVIRAMGMAKGHWFKCPNGHYYAIGECGGATQTSKCIECGAAVGGSNHALLSTNRHAGELDGSSYAAYSEVANNLFNFEQF